MVDSVTRLRDFRFYCQNWWSLFDKGNLERDPKLVKFKLNNAQRRVNQVLVEQDKARKPMRAKVLKFRQAGLSMYSIALMMHAAMTRQGINAITIADKLDLPKEFLRQCKQWYLQTPEALRPHAANTNAIELYFDILRSRYFIGSQAGQTPGMGYTIQRAHFSEVANWADPEKILDDVMPAIPQAKGTAVLFESTGEVAGDWWYKAFRASLEGEDEYAAIFLPWYIQEEYRRPDLADDILTYTEAEREIVRIARLNDGIEIGKDQIAWRRAGIRGEPYHGDEVGFNCKFPNTIEEAFLSAGQNVFSAEEVRKAAETVRDPIFRGEILPKDNPVEFNIIPSEGGTLLIWERPSEGRHYAIGADCQWGSKGEDPDFDSCYVQCVETGNICARIHARMPMGDWARVMASLGHYYNIASLAPERNSEAAKGVMLPLLGMAGNSWRYPNLWVRTKTKAFGGLQAVDYGWLTDKHSKPELIMKTHERMLGRMDWADKRAVEQMQSYIRNEKNELTAPAGQHDDDLMARMITAEVASDVLADLATNPIQASYGNLSDFMHRVVEHTEKMEQVDALEHRKMLGVEEW